MPPLFTIPELHVRRAWLEQKDDECSYLPLPGSPGLFSMWSTSWGHQDVPLRNWQQLWSFETSWPICVSHLFPFSSFCLCLNIPVLSIICPSSPLFKSRCFFLLGVLWRCVSGCWELAYLGAIDTCHSYSPASGFPFFSFLSFHTQTCPFTLHCYQS